MKKFFVITVLMFLCVLTVIACSMNRGVGEQIPRTDAVIAGKIVQMYGNTFLLAGIGASDLYTVSSILKIYDEDSKAADTAALKAGQEVEVGYSGSIMESYPAQLGEPVYLKIIRQGDDLVGFYRSILNDLWNKDIGLNPDIGILAFDLTQIVNLSEAEKSALIYTMSEDYGLTGIAGTFGELSKQGYINKEKLYFENGMLIRFELTDMAEDSFTFDVTKWRSGTGAYIFHDCKAEKTDGTWSYTVGSEMIS